MAFWTALFIMSAIRMSSQKFIAFSRGLFAIVESGLTRNGLFTRTIAIEKRSTLRDGIATFVGPEHGSFDYVEDTSTCLMGVHQW